MLCFWAHYGSGLIACSGPAPLAAARWGPFSFETGQSLVAAPVSCSVAPAVLPGSFCFTHRLALCRCLARTHAGCLFGTPLGVCRVVQHLGHTLARRWASCGGPVEPLRGLPVVPALCASGALPALCCFCEEQAFGADHLLLGCAASPSTVVATSAAVTCWRAHGQAASALGN